jgi:hypothetical protein
MPRGEWRFPGEVVPKPTAHKDDCDHIRRKIGAFVASKTLSKKEFLNRCGALIGKETINSGSYASFMALKGPDAGEDFGLYHAALAFFSDSDTAPAVAAAAAAAPSKVEAAESFTELCAELAGIELPETDDGEDVTDEMTCTVLRRRLNEFIAAHGITQSSLMAHLRVSPTTWSNFMSYKGPYQGSQSGLYASGLSFFTKLRVLKDAAKKKKPVGPGGRGGGHKIKPLRVARSDAVSTAPSRSASASTPASTLAAAAVLLPVPKVAGCIDPVSVAPADAAGKRKRGE